MAHQQQTEPVVDGSSRNSRSTNDPPTASSSSSSFACTSSSSACTSSSSSSSSACTSSVFISSFSGGQAANAAGACSVPDSSLKATAVGRPCGQRGAGAAAAVVQSHASPAVAAGRTISSRRAGSFTPCRDLSSLSLPVSSAAAAKRSCDTTPAASALAVSNSRSSVGGAASSAVAAAASSSVTSAAAAAGVHALKLHRAQLSLLQPRDPYALPVLPAAILDDDTYAKTVSHIITRDYYPDLPLLRLLQQLFEAERQQDTGRAAQLLRRINMLTPATVRNVRHVSGVSSAASVVEAADARLALAAAAASRARRKKRPSSPPVGAPATSPTAAASDKCAADSVAGAVMSNSVESAVALAPRGAGGASRVRRAAAVRDAAAAAASVEIIDAARAARGVSPAAASNAPTTSAAACKGPSSVAAAGSSHNIKTIAAPGQAVAQCDEEVGAALIAVECGTEGREETAECSLVSREYITVESSEEETSSLSGDETPPSAATAGDSRREKPPTKKRKRETGATEPSEVPEATAAGEIKAAGRAAAVGVGVVEKGIVEEGVVEEEGRGSGGMRIEQKERVLSWRDRQWRRRQQQQEDERKQPEGEEVPKDSQAKQKEKETEEEYQKGEEQRQELEQYPPAAAATGEEACGVGKEGISTPKYSHEYAVRDSSRPVGQSVAAAAAARGIKETTKKKDEKRRWKGYGGSTASCRAMTASGSSVLQTTAGCSHAAAAEGEPLILTRLQSGGLHRVRSELRLDIFLKRYSSEASRSFWQLIREERQQQREHGWRQWAEKEQQQHNYKMLEIQRETVQGKSSQHLAVGFIDTQSNLFQKNAEVLPPQQQPYELSRRSGQINNANTRYGRRERLQQHLMTKLAAAQEQQRVAAAAARKAVDLRPWGVGRKAAAGDMAAASATAAGAAADTFTSASLAPREAAAAAVAVAAAAGHAVEGAAARDSSAAGDASDNAKYASLLQPLARTTWAELLSTPALIAAGSPCSTPLLGSSIYEPCPVNSFSAAGGVGSSAAGGAAAAVDLSTFHLPALRPSERALERLQQRAAARMQQQQSRRVQHVLGTQLLYASGSSSTRVSRPAAAAAQAAALLLSRSRTGSSTRSTYGNI